MIIGWSWEWPISPCKYGKVPHDWAKHSFTVTNYEPGVTVTKSWISCRECLKKKP